MVQSTTNWEEMCGGSSYRFTYACSFIIVKK